ncbi:MULTISPECIES: MarR family winged helix-turn-helix transcriptional regulator [unclassified Kribbella]|uniref:MarR family winged helix-turn-helix transcriptional regulator n=1 Tax=unclassified Kribbella TaxID=2644121 RepID=UPI00378E0FE8|nr:MarR family transcriptional regulator [Kribbella sp. NBC_00889]
MSQRISPSAVQAASDVRVMFGRVKRRLKELAEHDDLTPSQSSVLSRLDKDGPASASELAAVERVRPQSMAAILAGLRESDLIERHPDPEDGRRQVVSLTTAGRHRLQGDRKVRQEWLARALQDGCTETERQTIIKALALLDHALDTTAAPRAATSR